MPQPPTSRIWYQSISDPQRRTPYLEKLSNYISGVARPGFVFEVNGASRSRGSHRIAEQLFATRVIRAALNAERQGYDAFVIGNFQDAGLYEARSAVGIPVLGLGEASMLYACMLGGKIAVVTVDPQLVPFQEEQVLKYRLEKRVVAVVSTNTTGADYSRAFSDQEAYVALRSAFREVVLKLAERGVEVIVPAGGMPMMLFADETNFDVNGVVVLNGVAVLIKMTELAIELRRLHGTEPSRLSTFASPAPSVADLFLADNGSL